MTLTLREQLRVEELLNLFWKCVFIFFSHFGVIMREKPREHGILIVIYILLLEVVHAVQEPDLRHHLFELAIEPLSLSLPVQYQTELVLKVECPTHRPVFPLIIQSFCGSCIEILHEFLSLIVYLPEHPCVLGLHKLIPLVDQVECLV